MLVPPFIVPILIVLNGTSNNLHCSFWKNSLSFNTSFKNNIAFSLLDSLGIGLLEWTAVPLKVNSYSSNPLEPTQG